MSSFGNSGLFSIFVKDITRSESATKKLLKTFSKRQVVLITQRKPITPLDDFKRNPADVVPPLCDITGDLEEVTNAVERACCGCCDQCSSRHPRPILSNNRKIYGTLAESPFLFIGHANTPQPPTHLGARQKRVGLFQFEGGRKY